MSYILPDLKYDYDSLEPYFDSMTMRIHHQKHHQTYITNANTILNSMNYPNIQAEILITKLNEIPLINQLNLRNNLGGHVNHCLFWNGLKVGTILQGSLYQALKNKFTTIENFKSNFENIALSRFGSGWVWLVYDNHDLKIISTANQDNPLMGYDVVKVSGYPIVGLDVWEHAYYLKYQNRRLDYVKSFWNVVNWEEALKRYNNCIC
ncbi:Superoxide dismutase [Mn] [Buchnera aphidicola (Eriosoma lanigerum)]|uniref:Fe-Mn family superoxide dismutase n=1 Tax=Buchnera aphidicola TaxID=9 RepID=UPI003464E11A